MSQDHIYEQRWEFRRKNGDLDSSSEDKESSSARARTLKKCNPLEEEETSHNHELNPPKTRAAKRQRNSAKNTQDKTTKKNNHRRGPRTAKPKKQSKNLGNNNKNNLNSSLHGLEMHVNLLVKELNTSREGLMKWMEDELEKLVSGSPSKPSSKGKRKVTKKSQESCKKPPKANARSSKKANANGGSCRVDQEAKEEALNLSKTSMVLALADNNTKGNENTNRAIVGSNYLNLANLNPRPLAENYLVKANPSTLRIQPVVVNPLDSMQKQSGAYYQGMSLQSERDLSGSMGSYGVFPSTSHVGSKAGFNVHNLGLGGSDTLAQENNFPSLRMMRFFNGVRDDDMNNIHHLKYPN